MAAMATELRVELISGRVCTVEVFPQMKIAELQEKLKAAVFFRYAVVVVVIDVIHFFLQETNEPFAF